VSQIRLYFCIFVFRYSLYLHKHDNSSVISPFQATRKYCTYNTVSIYLISLKESWKNGISCNTVFLFFRLQSFCCQKESSLIINSCRENTRLLLNSVQLFHQTAMTNINNGLTFSHIFQITCMLHDLRFSQHTAEESRLLAYGTATIGRLFPTHQR
jgi:hypothetical protein